MKARVLLLNLRPSPPHCRLTRARRLFYSLETKPRAHLHVFPSVRALPLRQSMAQRRRTSPLHGLLLAVAALLCCLAPRGAGVAAAAPAATLPPGVLRGTGRTVGLGGRNGETWRGEIIPVSWYAPLALGPPRASATSGCAMRIRRSRAAATQTHECKHLPPNARPRHLPGRRAPSFCATSCRQRSATI